MFKPFYVTLLCLGETGFSSTGRGMSSLLLLRGLLVLCLFHSFSGLTQTLVLEKDHVSLGKQVGVLEDKNGEWTIDQISSEAFQGRFKPGDKDAYNFGVTDSVYWMGFTVENPEADRRPWLLEVAPGWLTGVTLFLERPDGGFQESRTGAEFPFSQRQMNHPNFVFELELDPGQRRRIYLKISTKTEFRWSLNMWTPKAFAERTSQDFFLLGVFFGLMIAMILYNFFIYLSVKDKSYLYYILYIASFTLFSFSMEGLSYQYLWPDQPFWNSIAGIVLTGIVTFWTVLFTGRFLRIRTYSVGAHNLLWVVGLGSLLSPCLIFWYPLALYFTYVLVLCLIVVVLVSCFISLRNGYRPARYFLTAWVVLLLGCFLYIAQGLGFIPPSFLAVKGIYFGSGLEVLLLSLGLASRINELKEETFLTRESMRFTEAMNLKLENQVQERTLQLEKRGERLKELNDVLDDRNKELDDKNMELQTLVEIIRSINEKTDLRDLFHDLLVQGKILFPKTEKAVFLTLKGHTFKVACSMGFKGASFENVDIGADPLIDAFRRGSLVLDKGVYLLRKKGVVTISQLMELETSPKSMLAMALNMAGKPVGVLLLMHEAEAGFARSDIGKLERFRQHAVSALARILLIEQLEVKTQQVMRGLRYTQIQIALEPVKDRMVRALPDHFVLFKPMGRVSCDFLWFHEIGDLQFIAVGDSPGHLGDGPFLSMVGYQILERIVMEKGVLGLVDIMVHMDASLGKALMGEAGISLSGDGMGMALCCLNVKTGLVKFVGASRSLHYVKGGVVHCLNAMPWMLGLGHKEFSFKEHQLQLDDGDCFYLSSAGAIEQTNARGIAYGEERYQHTLSAISGNKMWRQGEIIWDAMGGFRGPSGRTRDVAVVGIKLTPGKGG